MADVGTDETVMAAVRRPWSRSIGVGALAAVAGFSFGLIAVALPLFGLARALELQRGLGRPVIRDNLLLLVLPVAGTCALACGLLVGRWYRRGGRLPGE
jgi:hypothetical protein